MPKCPICGRWFEYLLFMKCVDCLGLVKRLNESGKKLSCLDLIYGRIK